MPRHVTLCVLSHLPPFQVLTKWRFSCTLALPWRPLLAAAGGTTHVIDPSSGLVVRHVEMWDVEPSKVVAQLFKPAVKVWEQCGRCCHVASCNPLWRWRWWWCPTLMRGAWDRCAGKAFIAILFPFEVLKESVGAVWRIRGTLRYCAVCACNQSQRAL